MSKLAPPDQQESDSAYPLSNLADAPADPIFGLVEQFKKDKHPQKITLCAGIYLNERGINPVPNSVKQAEGILLESEKSKSYLNIEGEAFYGKLVQELILGAKHPYLASQRVVTLHTPGGTGALRLSADLAFHALRSRTVWLSTPSWINHESLFQAAGFAVKYYPYLNLANQSVDQAQMLAKLEQVSAGDLVVLQVCCHNPSGVDMSEDCWQQVAKVLAKKGALALLDCAYQGFGTGIIPDVKAVCTMAESGQDFMVAYSFSKTMGLYRERTGALMMVCQSETQAKRALSQAKYYARVTYSSPPSHGGKIVALVLDTPALRTEWEQEITKMRQRIQQMRDLFVKKLSSVVEIDFNQLANQKGMFALTGLSIEHVQILRKRFGVYLLDSGRINISALTLENLDHVVDAIKATLVSR